MDNWEIRKIRSILPRTRFIQGPFIPVMRIVIDMGFYDILKKYLMDEESKEIIAIAVSKIASPAGFINWHMVRGYFSFQNHEHRDKIAADIRTP